ncbi:restriction endonuclease subunit S [Butyrivibrio sp.]|uniref:restriction endonuclease subunit S n=1 Tax=Butyrivibrio sp. TaxID=28121 RepID=UPI0025C34EAE|nr:restriction endonuclease subunit S [Butyrivibrio sp.]MBE5838364.1 restriction endonuclease subunit S [Butyrivibrio sp.]
MRVKLEDVCERGSSNLKQSDIIDATGDYPIYGASGYIGNVDFYHQDKPYVAVVKDGAGIGRTTLHPAKSSVIGTMQYLLPKENVLPEYLCYVVRYMHLEKYFTGATIPHIYFKDYKNEQFNLDSLERQAEIVDILGKCERVIVSREDELQKLDELIKARFVELFGDPIKNTKSLMVKRLEELGTWNSGGTPSRTKPEYFTGDINWYSAGELNSLYLHGSIEKITASAIEESAAKLFRAGSMLVGMYDTAAFKMGILKEDSASNQACACIEPNESVNIVWLYYALSLMKENYLSQRRGVRQKNLNLGMIRGFELPVAEKKDQDEFVKFVEQIDKSKVAVQKSLDETQKLFDSLMQEYFG